MLGRRASPKGVARGASRPCKPLPVVDGLRFDSRRLHHYFINKINRLINCFWIQGSSQNPSLNFTLNSNSYKVTKLKHFYALVGQRQVILSSEKANIRALIFLDAGPLEHANNEKSSFEEGVGPLKIWSHCKIFPVYWYNQNLQKFSGIDQVSILPISYYLEIRKRNLR